MSSYTGQPAPRSETFDFLAMVRGRANSAGYDDALPEKDLDTIDSILSDYTTAGWNAALERRAHMQLVSMCANLVSRAFLDQDEQERLDALLAPQEQSQVRQPARRASTGFRPRPFVIAVVVAVIAVVLGVGIKALVDAANPANPQQTGTVQQHPPAQQVPPGTTDLQNFKQDWGPWEQITPSEQDPQTGTPALLYYEQGGYFVSQDWTIPANSPAWQTDLSGNVNNVNVQGNHALITDADGNQIVVGINQAFVLSRDPGTILKIDPTGQVWSIPEAHGISPDVRKHL